MDRLTRAVSPAAVALGVAGAVLGVLVAARGPVSTLTWVIVVSGVVYLPVALVGSALARADRRNPVGWIFLVSGATVPLSGATQAAVSVSLGSGGPDPNVLQLVTNALLCMGVFPLVGFGLLLFPDGRLGSRRRRVVAWICGLHLTTVVVWAMLDVDNFSSVPGVVNPIGVKGPAADVVSALIIGLLLTGPVAAACSWALLRKASRYDGAARRGMHLAASAGFAVAAAFLACVVIGVAGGDTNQVGVVEDAATVALGLAAWAGIVRYGLFDVRVVLSRSLTYGLLLVAVIAVYAGVTVALDTLLGHVTSSTLATALAVIVALPLREWLARRVRTGVYGLRDEPGVAFARLGERLTAVGSPGEVLPAAARTVAESLRLPYVAIEVDGRVLATAGTPWPGVVERVALPYGGETVGTLVLQHTETRVHPRAATLLDSLVRQVALAARSVSLAEDLQRSRETLVASREDERRRLRRELHDGLGPTMAGIALGIDTIARDAATPPASRDALRVLRHETERAVGEVRRIVYGLRPPVLDELGLAAALEEQAARLGGAELDIEKLPPLPAAVEVAAYRITVEAIANAHRHAPGARVRVRITAGKGLEMTITDDGPGLPAGFVAGVGITSMRERAAELGGSLTVTRSDPGTLVHVTLPLTTSIPHAVAAS